MEDKLSEKYWKKHKFLCSLSHRSETAVTNQWEFYALPDTHKANYDKLVSLEAKIEVLENVGKTEDAITIQLKKYYTQLKKELNL